MKYKLMSMILALTVVSWAQTATQSTPSTTDQSTSGKAKCACCDKMARSDSKEAHASCMRAHDGKETNPAAQGKTLRLA
jgi:predicted metal-binding membrane protein